MVTRTCLAKGLTELVLVGMFSVATSVGVFQVADYVGDYLKKSYQEKKDCSSEDCINLGPEFTTFFPNRTENSSDLAYSLQVK